MVVAVWYFALFVIGLLALPICLYLFKSLTDYAYPFSRIIGLAIISYLVWIFGSLRILPFGIPSIIIAALIMAALSAYILYFKRVVLTWKIVKKAIFYELLFLAVFAVLIAYKLYRSEISDIEKFMDFAFLNTILKSSFFPPQDPWYSGHAVNYYYFGHLIGAILTKITGIQSAVSYNLMQATVYALFMVELFSVGFNLTKKYIWAALTVLVVAGISNISYLIFSMTNTATFWWQGTRIIPGTINEFPLYSFLLGDLHAHYLDLPFVILMLISFLIFFKDSDNRYPLKVFIGFIFGLMFITNSWDYIIYGFVFALLSIYKNYFRKKDHIQVIKDGLVVGATSVLVMLPFYLSFHPASEGFRLVTAPKSLLSDFLILFSFQIFVIAYYLMYNFVKSKSEDKRIAIVASVVIGLALFWTSQVAALVGVLFPLWMVVFLDEKKRGKGLGAKQFVNILILICFSIIVFCEYVYLKDIYGIDWQRCNTVFKFYYQLMVLFAIVAGYIGYYFWGVRGRVKLLFFFVSGSLLILSAYFVPNIIFQSANFFSVKMGLDGTYYLARSRPYDNQAVNWINDNISGQKVIAEMPGNSYSDDSRISAFTGNVTPLGWLGHEWGWRNNPDVLTGIKNDIDVLFRTPDAVIAKTIIDKYQIDYIYYGELEQANYVENDNWIVPKIYRAVYNNTGVVIYQTVEK